MPGRSISVPSPNVAPVALANLERRGETTRNRGTAPVLLALPPLLALALGLAGCAPAPRPPNAESRWIDERAEPIRTIDPSDTRFDDLAPLGRAIGRSRIVMLGEQNHGDGSTFLAKTRIIEYLHQELGFDVLAIESGLFACERAGDAILAGRPAREMVEASVFDVWTSSAELSPLVRYLDEARSSANPLELTGFDPQLTGSLSRERLVPELQAALGDSPEARSVLETIGLLATSPRRFRKIEEPERERFRANAETLLAALDGRADAESRFLAQVLRSTVQLARFLWEADFEHPVPAVMNLRDAQMADNLLWLARERYPGRKIVVWAATSHVSRNRQAIERPIPDPGMVPMGETLWRTLGEEVYVLAFTSARGRFGTWRSAPDDLARPRAGSLEDAFDRTGQNTLFLDLRGGVHDGDWLAKPVLARPMGYVRMTARWPDIFDGLVFIKTMAPSTSAK